MVYSEMVDVHKCLRGDTPSFSLLHCRNAKYNWPRSRTSGVRVANGD